MLYFTLPLFSMWGHQYIITVLNREDLIYVQDDVNLIKVIV